MSGVAAQAAIASGGSRNVFAMTDAEAVFVGGAGPSATHVLAGLLGRHPRLAEIPIESRFHCDEGGMPDLIGGRVTLADFLDRLRGRWWHRVRADGQPRGLYNVLTRKQLDAAIAPFQAAYPSDPLLACRELFVDLLEPFVTDEGKPGLVEMSSHNVTAAPTLRRLFAEARFIHAVRDGRHAAASVTTEAYGPESVLKGIDWWADRLRAIEAGVRGADDDAAEALSPAELCVVILDDLVWGDREGAYDGCSISWGSKTTSRCGSSSTPGCSPKPPRWRGGGRGWGGSSARGWSEGMRLR